MRAAPALQVSLVRFGVWRASMLLLALFGGLAIEAWVLAQESLEGAGQVLVMAVAAGVSLWLGVSAAKVPAVQLSWNGENWALGPIAPTTAGCAVGEISVAIDLGPWMLLRFRSAHATRWAASNWLPVQRRGIEPQWHALRCAVYSPRPLDATRALVVDPPTSR